MANQAPVENVIRLAALNDTCDGPIRVIGINFEGAGANAITLQNRAGSPSTVLISVLLSATANQYVPLNGMVFPTGLKWSAGAVGAVAIFLASSENIPAPVRFTPS